MTMDTLTALLSNGSDVVVYMVLWLVYKQDQFQKKFDVYEKHVQKQISNLETNFRFLKHQIEQVKK